MFSSVNDRACLEISAPAPGTEPIDLLAASKNIPKAFSACSMVFSARSRSSAGTSSFGSIMISIPPVHHGLVPHLGHGVSASWREFVAHRAALRGPAPPNQHAERLESNVRSTVLLTLSGETHKGTPPSMNRLGNLP